MAGLDNGRSEEELKINANLQESERSSLRGRVSTRSGKDANQQAGHRRGLIVVNKRTWRP